jgi:hypothetical protein
MVSGAALTRESVEFLADSAAFAVVSADTTAGASSIGFPVLAPELQAAAKSTIIKRVKRVVFILTFF